MVKYTTSRILPQRAVMIKKPPGSLPRQAVSFFPADLARNLLLPVAANAVRAPLRAAQEALCQPGTDVSILRPGGWGCDRLVGGPGRGHGLIWHCYGSVGAGTDRDRSVHAWCGWLQRQRGNRSPP